MVKGGTHATVHAEVRGPLPGADSLLPSCRFQELNSVWQAWQPAPPPTASSSASPHFFLCCFCWRRDIEQPYWLASKLQESPWLCLFNTGITVARPLASHRGALGFHMGPHACTAGILLTEPALWILPNTLSQQRQFL